MAVIEIRGSEIAHCVCSALIECCPDAPFVIAEPDAARRPLTVELTPGDDVLSIVAYGDSGGYPMEIGRRNVDYGDGPRILLLGEEFCRRVADEAESVLGMLTAEFGRFSRAWALWSTGDPARLLDLISYDTGPVTEARAREGLGRAVVPLDGRLEAIDQTRLTELRKTTEKGN